MNDLIARLDEFIGVGEGLSSESDHLLKGDNARECQYWLSRLLAFLRSSLPETSLPYQGAVEMAHHSHRSGGIYQQDIAILVGHLKAIRDAVKAGELRRFEDQVAAGDLRQFLDYSKVFGNQGRKVESSVIASAVFEDAVRRIADSHGIDRTTKLDVLISALQSARVISKLEAKKLRVYASIRNAALHASWDEFELSDVIDLIDGTDNLVNQHLGSGEAL